MAWVTQAEYARHRNCSRQAVSKALKAGRIVANEQGLIDTADADARWKGASSPTVHPNSLRGTATDDAPAPQEGGRSAAGTFAASRAVRESYLARMAKLEFEEKSGALVRRDLVRRFTFDTHRRVRELLLALPDRTTPLVATTPEETDRIYRILRAEVMRMCAELTGEFTAGRRSAGGGGAADGRVGGGVAATQ